VNASALDFLLINQILLQLHAIHIPTERCSSIYESYQGNFIEDMMKKGLEWSSLTQQENRLVDALAL